MIGNVRYYLNFILCIEEINRNYLSELIKFIGVVRGGVSIWIWSFEFSSYIFSYYYRVLFVAYLFLEYEFRVKDLRDF